MILGVDPGERRIGIALADEETRFAHPLEVIDAGDTDPVQRIASLVSEHAVRLVVVGRPLTLRGETGQAVRSQGELVAALRDAVGVELVEFDERLTTVVAEAGLRAGGAKRATRDRLRDAVAASAMLQGYLDRNTKGGPRHGPDA